MTYKQILICFTLMWRKIPLGGVSKHLLIPLFNLYLQQLTYL